MRWAADVGSVTFVGLAAVPDGQLDLHSYLLPPLAAGSILARLILERLLGFGSASSSGSDFCLRLLANNLASNFVVLLRGKVVSQLCPGSGAVSWLEIPDHFNKTSVREKLLDNWLERRLYRIGFHLLQNIQNKPANETDQCASLAAY